MFLQAYADALLVIPKILAQNSGYDPQETIVKLQVNMIWSAETTSTYTVFTSEYFESSLILLVVNKKDLRIFTMTDVKAFLSLWDGNSHPPHLFNVENVLFVLVIERLLVWKLWNGMKKIAKCPVHVLSLELRRNCDSNLDTLEC